MLGISEAAEYLGFRTLGVSTADGYAIMQSSDGYYRYAYQTQEGYLSTEGAPIVRGRGYFL